MIVVTIMPLLPGVNAVPYGSRNIALNRNQGRRVGKNKRSLKTFTVLQASRFGGDKEEKKILNGKTTFCSVSASSEICVANSNFHHLFRFVGHDHIAGQNWYWYLR